MAKKSKKAGQRDATVVELSKVKRMKAPERRAKIITIASILFSERGFNGTSIDLIAQYAKVSPAVLYKHFDTKKDLYEAVLADMAGQRDNYADIVIKGPDDFRSLLERMTMVFINNIEVCPAYLKLELQSILKSHDDDTDMLKGRVAVLQFFESRWKCFTDVIDFHMDQLSKKNKANIANSAAASLLYQGMIREALLAKCFYDSPRFQDISLQDLVAQLLDMFFNAIGYTDDTKSSM